MEIVIDTSVLLAVLLGKPEKKMIVAHTASHRLIGPSSIQWEIGNAFSYMLKEHTMDIFTAVALFDTFQNIPIKYVPVDFDSVNKISRELGISKYDGYFLDCAIRRNASILTLDMQMKEAARKMHIDLLEI